MRYACSENSRSQIVFRTDIFQILSLGAPGSRIKWKFESILYLSQDLMSKMWDEDRENIVECRYGQLSSTEKIKKKRNKTKQTRSNAKQNIWPCKCRAAVNRKFG